MNTLKVYKLTSQSTDKAFFGSTTMPLKWKLMDHKRWRRMHKNGIAGWSCSHQIARFDDVSISLVCDGLDEKAACALVDYCVRTQPCVNRKIPEAEKYSKEERKVMRYAYLLVLKEFGKLWKFHRSIKYINNCPRLKWLCARFEKTLKTGDGKDTYNAFKTTKGKVGFILKMLGMEFVCSTERRGDLWRSSTVMVKICRV